MCLEANLRRINSHIFQDPIIIRRRRGLGGDQKVLSYRGPFLKFCAFVVCVGQCTRLFSIERTTCLMN